jgi:hypothetical protein
MKARYPEPFFLIIRGGLDFLALPLVPLTVPLTHLPLVAINLDNLNNHNKLLGGRSYNTVAYRYLHHMGFHNGDTNPLIYLLWVFLKQPTVQSHISKFWIISRI